jgi:hypothetical protein
MLQPNFLFFIFPNKLFWNWSTIRIVHKDSPLDCSLNAQSGCVMVSFGLFIKKMNELKLIELIVFTFYRWSILKLIIYVTTKLLFFLFFNQTILKLFDHKDCLFKCPLDCPLNAQSGCLMVSFGLFIKRMIELFVFTFYRWSILKLIIYVTTKLLFLFFRTNYFEIVHWRP